MNLLPSQGKVVIFGHKYSQPTRACLWLCQLNQIPHEFRFIDLSRGQHRTPEFARLNPNLKVPVMLDSDGFTLYESHTIMRYLCQKFNVATNWYPSNLNQRCKIDSMLDWHHTTLRIGAAPLFRDTIMRSLIDPSYNLELKQLIKTYNQLKEALNFMNELLATQKYLANDQPSIADLSSVCELAQLKVLDFSFENWVHVDNWFKNLKAIEGFEEVHDSIFRMHSKVSQQRQHFQNLLSQMQNANL
eukprot:TRINITY_DN520_c0_g1_i2.p1 TRINITY_DN520_c0_g1~~TRINITY_DN520_c0_g1_i2.p1  ORF type:complete len:245 (-),score=114.06 TRINITY_DN520_c0_g1_i2:196-930(-)